MEKEILEIITQHKCGQINSQQAVTELLRLFNVSGQVFCTCIVSKVSDSEFPIFCNNCNAYVQPYT